MSHATYPTASDLTTLLTACGMISSPQTTGDTLLLGEDALSAAAEEWERVTGWKPFLKDAADVTRVFDPPGAPTLKRTGPTVFGTGYVRGGGRILNLGAGLVTLTSVTVGKVTGMTGTLLTQGTDYWLLPYDTATAQAPYTSIEFMVPQFGAAQSIEIIGKWGWGATLPEDVWYAIMCRAGKRVAGQLMAQTSGGLESVKIGDHEFKWGKAPFAATVDQWDSDWRATTLRYRRVTL